MKKTRVTALTESAAMIALASILSLIEVIKMPFGGGITAAAMLPIILISYRHKLKWGLLSAFAYAVIQMLFGMQNLQYGTTFFAVCAIIFLDYIFAFAVLGIAGIFRDRFSSQGSEIVCGTLIACFLRYVCHVVSGCTVWTGVSIPTSDGLIYSLAYNAAYMIPETVITIAAAWYLCYLLDFKSDKLSVRVKRESKTAAILSGLGILFVLITVVFDALYIFSLIQTEEQFDMTGIMNADPLLLGTVTGVGILLWLILSAVAKHKK